MSFQLMDTTEKQALATVNTPQDNQDVQAKQFIPVNGFTTFRAEFLLEGSDIIFHFFLAPEVFERAAELKEKPEELKSLEARVQKYWLDSFPRSLDVVARDFFKTDKERLAATYVDDFDLKSWWLKAKGFALEGLDPSTRCYLFCEKLDQALEALKVNLLLV